MKITLIRANPRKNGYTQKLTDLFIEGLNRGDADLKVIDITRKNINQCLGCYTCWVETPGKCIHNDDMVYVMEEFCKSDIVVFASPLYIYGISGYLKVFFDRLLAYMKNEHLEASREHIRNAIRDPEKWPKKMAYILVGAFKGMGTFDGAKKTLDLFSEGLNMPLCGSIIRPESYFLPYIFIKPKTIRLIESAFSIAGFELAQNGSISEATINKASAPLLNNTNHFIEDSNIYWQEAQKIGKNAKNPDSVTEALLRNPKLLLREMARNIDPQATSRISASIQFDFTGHGSHFNITIDKGKCSFQEKSSDKPDLRITTEPGTWVQIFLREINIPKAIAEKKIILEGDKSIFKRFDKYFPISFE
ncbi:MAG: NAD(P)H-dependent oxidoreductase [Proteobacteria bacterium]|nr:NAD(P)H-dependent oxidoreductase [Pseudomonadota bacterium]